MPGRRSPRTSSEISQSTHLQNTFQGALNGASALPAPVGEQSATARSQGSPPVYFYQNRFTASGGAQTVPLTYIPLAYSEHVYLLRSGANGVGAQQGEGKAWVRTSGTPNLQILTGMNTHPGDTIVVEYAYQDIKRPEFSDVITPPMSYSSITVPYQINSNGVKYAWYQVPLGLGGSIDLWTSAATVDTGYSYPHYVQLSCRSGAWGGGTQDMALVTIYYTLVDIAYPWFRTYPYIPNNEMAEAGAQGFQPLGGPLYKLSGMTSQQQAAWDAYAASNPGTLTSNSRFKVSYRGTAFYHDDTAPVKEWMLPSMVLTKFVDKPASIYSSMQYYGQTQYLHRFYVPKATSPMTVVATPTPPVIRDEPLYAVGSNMNQADWSGSANMPLSSVTYSGEPNLICVAMATQKMVDRHNPVYVSPAIWWNEQIGINGSSAYNCLTSPQVSYQPPEYRLWFASK